MAKNPFTKFHAASNSAELDWPFRRPCTKRELAEQVGSTERFIELETNRGNLRAVRVGVRGIRFLPSDIVRWLNARPVGQK